MLAPQGVVVRASDIVVFNDFALLVDARDGHEGCPRASGFGISDRGLFYLDRGCCPAPDFRRTRTSPARFPHVFPGTTVRRWNFALPEHRILSHITADEAR